MEISAWISSIIGVCFLSVLVDLMLPDGKTNTLIKKVVSYIIVAIVLMPLINLANNKNNIQDVFSYSEIQIQENYIYNINQSKIDAIKESIQKELESKGILGVQISVSADVFVQEMEIYAIYVDLYNMVISGDSKNKNIKTEVVSVVQNYVNIAKEKIIIYE